MLKGDFLEVAQRKTEKTVYPNLSSTASLGFMQVYSEIRSLQAKNSGWVAANSIFFSPRKLCRSHVSSTPSQFFSLMRAYFFLPGSIYMHWFCIPAERALNV